MKTTRILFQGDSITDAGRSRDNVPPNCGLGQGYCSMAAARLLADKPGGFEILNRGISGNRVVDLYGRWKADALNLKPDVLSILIGVNDTWHEFEGKNGVEPERYGRFYRMLLEWARETLPDVGIVVCEPFVLPCGVVTAEWQTEMAVRRAICAELSAEFGLPLVPFQKMFDDAQREAPAEFWAEDGVHPSLAGHQRMADLWLATAGNLL